MDIDTFLDSTLQYTLPHLICERRIDVIERISQILHTDVPNMCVNKMHDILAHLFMHAEDKITPATKFFISIASSNFNNITVTRLLRSCTLYLVTNLAVELGDENEETRERAEKALRYVDGKLSSKDGEEGREREKEEERTEGSLSQFLKQYFLGILTSISDYINDSRGQYMISKKVKTVRSLTELLKLIGADIHTVTPQIMAMLQTVLNQPQLREVALHAWQVFIKTLKIEHIGPLLNQIIAILLKVFPDCTPSQSQEIVNIFEHLIIKNGRRMKNFFPDVGVLPDYPELAPFRTVLRAAQDKLDQMERLQRLLRRVAHENPILSQNALVELKNLLEEQQEHLCQRMLAETVDPVVSELIRVLLESFSRYDGNNADIQRLCSECLGIVGAVDPGRLDISISEEKIVVLSNFTDREESVEYACKVIEKQLVGAFRSARTTSLQNHLAFAIQELLKFCGFTPDLLVSSRTSSKMSEAQKRVRERWNSFPKLVLETVSPLLGAKYYVLPVPIRPQEYPIYPRKPGFKEWLQAWTVDLIGKVTEENSKQIFGTCKNVVKLADAGIALFLLPHLVLNVLITGTDKDREEIFTELLAVLKDGISISQSGVLHEKRQLSSQTIFSLVDHLTRWLQMKRQSENSKKRAIAKRAGRYVSVDEELNRDDSLKHVENLLSRIPQDIMAESSYHCKAYARALMHFEQHIRNQRNTSKSEQEMQPLYKQLQRIYAHIDEPDGMDGIATMFLDMALEQQILEHESAGRWTAAQTCYELSLQQNPDNLEHHLGLMNCLKNLGHLETMLTHVNGIATRHPEWYNQINAYGIEASWRLADWASLEEFLSRAHDISFEVLVGKVVLAMRQQDALSFHTWLGHAREALMATLAAASRESYRRAYDVITKLHMLYELETSLCLRDSATSRQSFEEAASNLFRLWEARLQITQPTFKVREPILNLRRIALQNLKSSEVVRLNSVPLHQEISRIWLQSAKTARKAGYFQTAYSAILHASELRAPFIYTERAKWLWDQHENRKAMQELKNALIVHGPSLVGAGGSNISTDSISAARDVSLDTKSEGFVRAKALLLLTRWMESMSMSDSKTLLKEYDAVTNDQPQWEKGYFYLGRYYNSLLEDSRKTNQSTVYQTDLIYHTIKCYGRALCFGTRYIYQTMPRLLTIWLDFGATPGLIETGRGESEKATLRREKITERFNAVNSLVKKLNERLPAYQFLTCFPQIISRICHRNKNVFQVLEMIIINVLTSYPQQALWSMMSVSRSTYSIRKSRCNNILAKLKSDQHSKVNGVNVETLIQQAMKLTDQLLNLCNFSIGQRETMLSINRDFRTLQRMTPLQIIVPLQSTLIPSLPASSQTLSSHLPFMNDLPTIAGFQDEVEIMLSLQRPRKITIIGSDGKNYIFLCKPKDDLRKDARLMEFNSMINKLLKKDPESRKRLLHIRTYAVVPLNEECGLIEWVPNTTGLRHVLMKLFRSKNITVSHQEIKQILEQTQPTPQDVFLKKLLPKFPPVLHEWFLENFPEPTSWLASRLAYATTLAVMSMVGFILGLGDRHGENILFDELSGDIIHVDFNCLFDKGLAFEKPEKVPFRLTHNLVDALGITGYEGVFRKSCEVSLRVLRNNKESLMSVLETFMHDPLCEWSKKKANSSGEVENEQAKKTLTTIERKLLGEAKEGPALSIEGQVQELIRQATDPLNLYQMYIGWAAYM
ncbi:uncharacterized protein VTP21DRAFT_6087 [Calcarisporiella thermophila]|uniref:uncharacterized protein n=1 Tax=Calcarisporiella thermophila TaxID=911321 RepID=UPI003744832E